MAEVVILNQFKKKIMDAVSGNGNVPVITGMAFGTGADTNTAPASASTSLVNEIYRKDITEVTVISDTIRRYTCELEEEELAGQVLNEIALYDQEGDLAAVKVFISKPKDDDMIMIFEANISL